MKQSRDLPCAISNRRKNSSSQATASTVQHHQIIKFIGRSTDKIKESSQKDSAKSALTEPTQISSTGAISASALSVSAKGANNKRTWPDTTGPEIGTQRQPSKKYIVEMSSDNNNSTRETNNNDDLIEDKPLNPELMELKRFWCTYWPKTGTPEKGYTGVKEWQETWSKWIKCGNIIKEN